MPEALPELKRPPINEVVYGFRFAPPPLFKLAHYGLYWTRVRDRYPRSEDIDPIFDLPTAAQPTIDLEKHGRRVWFLDNTDTRLIQVQRDRFYMNWRQVRPDDEYPRFSKLFPEFKQTVADFADFVKEVGLGVLQPNQLELTYINHIYEGGGWKFPANAGAVLTPLGWKREPKHRLGSPSDLGWRTTFDLPDGQTKLVTSVGSGKRKMDDAPALVFELRAVSANERPLEEALAWYESARESIVRAFFDLTTAEAREKLWT